MLSRCVLLDGDESKSHVLVRRFFIRISGGYGVSTSESVALFVARGFRRIRVIFRGMRFAGETELRMLRNFEMDLIPF